MHTRTRSTRDLMVAHARRLSPAEFEALLGNPLRDEVSDDELYARIRDRILSDPDLGPAFMAEATLHDLDTGEGDVR